MEKIWKLAIIIAIAVLIPASVAAAPSASIIFAQCADDGYPQGGCTWMTSAIDQTNSNYFEGMSVPMRVTVERLKAGTHTIEINFDFTKKDVHGYDFVTGWDQGNIPQIVNLNDCDNSTVCSSLVLKTEVSAPSDSFLSTTGKTVNDKIQAFMDAYGAPTIKLYTDGSDIVVSENTVVSHTGPDDADSSATWKLTWTSTSPKIMIQFGAHLAVSGDPNEIPMAWGVEKGAGYFGGSPIHITVKSVDGSGSAGDLPISQIQKVGALRLNKTVINDDGGWASPSDFQGLVNINPDMFEELYPLFWEADIAVNKIVYPLGPRPYELSESGPTEYEPGVWTCNGITESDAVIDIVQDQVYTCTITNTYNPPPPVAQFSAPEEIVCADTQVSFTDESSGVFTSSEWSYKLNTSSEWETLDLDESNSYDFTTPGVYDIRLALTGPGGTSESIQTISINVGSITVESVPQDAKIWIDNVEMTEPTNSTIDGILIGDRTVKVAHYDGNGVADYFANQHHVCVVCGGTRSVSFELDPIPEGMEEYADVVFEAITRSGANTGGEPDVDTSIELCIGAPLPAGIQSLSEVEGTESNERDINEITHLATVYANDYDPEGNCIPLMDDGEVGSNEVCFITNDNTDGNYAYVDWDPEANWGHDASYYYLDSRGTQGSIDTNSPPLDENPRYATGKKVPLDEYMEIGDPKCWSPMCVQSASTYYALLIDGGVSSSMNYVRYWNDLSFMYNVLLEYGFSPSHIKVLMSDGTSTGLDRLNYNPSTNAYFNDNSPTDLNSPPDGKADVTGAATATNVLNTLGTYTSTSTLPLGSTLFIFTTGHGSLSSGSSDTSNKVLLNTWLNTYITDDDFIAKLNAIPPAQATRIVLVMQQCYSGGFYEEFINGAPSGQERVLITAANWNEPSWANGYSNAWMEGMSGHYRESTLPDECLNKADLNSDDRVTFKESIDYVYAAGRTTPNDKWATTISGLVSGKEHPTLWTTSNVNPSDKAYSLNYCSGTLTPSISSVTPSGVTIRQKSHQLITWTANALPTQTVKVELLKSGTPVATLGSGIAATQGYLGWDVPTTWSGTGIFKIRVTPSSGNAGSSAVSFSISTGLANPNGYISVTVTPTGSKIYLDGVDTGYTTSKTLTTNEGTHIVKVTKDGYYPQQSTVTVTAGRTATVSGSLALIGTQSNEDPEYYAENPSGLDVRSAPPGADIFVQGPSFLEVTNVGMTPSEIECEPGEYHVYVTRGDYSSETQTVTVETHTKYRQLELVTFDLPSTITFPLIWEIVGPEGAADIGEQVDVSAIVTDPSGIREGYWDWGDGTVIDSYAIVDSHEESDDTYDVHGHHKYVAGGIYLVTLEVTNENGKTNTVQVYIVVVDPTTTMTVTGVGWIQSPEGAYVLSPLATGTANVGAQAKYLNGRLTGNVQFQFAEGNLNFKATKYDWLVIGGPKAIFEGNGTINKKGDYRFRVTEFDGDLDGSGQDRFRIQIWNTDGSILYDNEMGAADYADPITALNGGSITIHG
jgi:PKD repeat protein